MPRLFRNLLAIKPAKPVEDRMRDLLIEMKAADKCKLELGRDWEDLTHRERKKLIEEIKYDMK